MNNSLTHLHRYAVIACLISINTVAQAAETACPDEFYQGKAPDLVNQAFSAKTKELCFTNFALMHSGLSRTALWSAEKLTAAALASAAYMERTNSFHEELRLPSSQRSELKDYKGSGFDRGHLAPSADMPTAQSQDESFSLANMVPQTAKNNRGIWAGIEKVTRDLAKARGNIYVVTGPIFAGEQLSALKGRVLIPTHMFKAVMDPKSGEMGAFISPNDESGDWKAVSVAELEKSIGWNIFPSVPTSQKAVLMDLGQPRPMYGDDGNKIRKVKF